MTLGQRLADGPLISMRLQAALAQTGSTPVFLAGTDANDPANFPPGPVQIERTGWRSTLGISGIALASGGIAAGATALIRSATSGGGARLHLPMMLAFGAAALVGGATAGASRLIGPRTEQALASGIPTREQAGDVARRISGRTKVVETADGSFAVLRDDRPVYSNDGGGSSGRSGGGSRTGGSGGSSRPPSYPSGGSSGRTSGGDDSGSSRNSTSNGNPSRDDF